MRGRCRSRASQRFFQLRTSLRNMLAYSESLFKLPCETHSDLRRSRFGPVLAHVSTNSPPQAFAIVTLSLSRHRGVLKFIRWPRSIAPIVVTLPSMSLILLAPFKDWEG